MSPSIVGSLEKSAEEDIANEYLPDLKAVRAAVDKVQRAQDNRTRRASRLSVDLGARLGGGRFLSVPDYGLIEDVHSLVRKVRGQGATEGEEEGSQRVRIFLQLF